MNTALNYAGDSPFNRCCFEQLGMLGHHAIPLKETSKLPAIADWQTWADCPPQPENLAKWSRIPEANAGIVLGSGAGINLQCIAIEIAVTGQEREALLAALPSTQMISAGPKTLTPFYLVDRGVTSRNYCTPAGRLLVALKARGTVAIIPPSADPDGSEYHWIGGVTQAAALPILTAEAIAALETELAKLSWRRDGEEGYATAFVPDDDPRNVCNENALANLAAWVPALDLYNARPVPGGYEAVATWRPSMTGREPENRKRALLIHRTGINDRGPDVDYSGLDLVMAARNETVDDAFAWLSDRLARVLNAASTAPAGHSVKLSRERQARRASAAA